MSNAAVDGSIYHKGRTYAEHCAWLDSLELAQYTPAFVDNHIDLALLPSLVEQDLKELGVASMGHRKKLLQAIGALAGEPAPAATLSAAAPTNRSMSCVRAMMVPVPSRITPIQPGGNFCRLRMRVRRCGEMVALRT